MSLKVRHKYSPRIYVPSIALISPLYVPSIALNLPNISLTERHDKRVDTCMRPCDKRLRTCGYVYTPMRQTYGYVDTCIRPCDKRLRTCNNDETAVLVYTHCCECTRVDACIRVHDKRLRTCTNDETAVLVYTCCCLCPQPPAGVWQYEC